MNALIAVASDAPQPVRSKLAVNAETRGAMQARHLGTPAYRLVADATERGQYGARPTRNNVTLGGLDPDKRRRPVPLASDGKRARTRTAPLARGRYFA